MKKKWYLSKTVWANVFATVGFFVSRQFGVTIPEEVFVTALGIVNLLLRSITKEGLTA